jgi:2-oxoisovalerate dehydrogenase E2 component (dihydrolipoyl transacylase)
MGFYSFKLPDLGEGIVESEVDKWHVQLGDRVEEDQPLADLITDKAVVEVSAPVAGTVVALACAAGKIVAVGSELVRFEVEGDGNVSPSTQQKQSPTSAPSATSTPDQTQEPSATRSSADTRPATQSSADTRPVTQSSADTRPSMQTSGDARPATQSSTGTSPAQTSAGTPLTTQSLANTPLTASTKASATRPPALPHRTILTSPSLRRRAREANIDLSLVPGSGPEGRITQRDLEAYLAAAGQQQSRKREGHTAIEVKGLRRVIAQKMQQSKRQIPHYSYIEEVDVTQLEELRQFLNAGRREEQPKLTLLPFILQALTRVLPDFPHCNAHFDEENNLLTQHQAVHAGIATMTPAGLLVPVIKHSESLDIWQSAAELARLSSAARNGQASRDELRGSTITITSLGALGGLATTPIINAPETAIIGINKLQDRPVVKNGMIVIRKIMNLSSSFDHRIVDGYDGAQLVQALKARLENPGAVLT